MGQIAVIGGEIPAHSDRGAALERPARDRRRGRLLGSKMAIPLIRKSGGGSIINIASNWGLVAFPNAAAYVTSKGAVRLLTKAAASEVAQDNIRVNSIHPSFTATAMTADTIANDPRFSIAICGEPIPSRMPRAKPQSYPP